MKLGAFWRRIFRSSADRRAWDVLPALPTGAPRHAGSAHRAVIAAACALPDDTLADDALLTAVAAEIEARRMSTGTVDGPESPLFTGLRVRRRGLPDWWENGENLFLCAPEVGDVYFLRGFSRVPRKNLIVVAGSNTWLPEIIFEGSNSLVVFGDDVRMLVSHFVVGEAATALIGEHTSASAKCRADIRNGGILIAGSDNMWANGVTFFSDDSHAIIDARTSARLNVYGGRRVLEQHVWLCDSVAILGDAYIGRDGIVGMGSFVKNRRLPPGAISVGRPARPVRTGVTWSRDDVSTQ